MHTFPVFLVVAAIPACSKMTNTTARKRCAHVPPVNRRPNSRLSPLSLSAIRHIKARSSYYFCCCDLSSNNNIINRKNITRYSQLCVMLQTPSGFTLSQLNCRLKLQFFFLFAGVYHVYPNTPTPPLLHCVYTVCRLSRRCSQAQSQCSQCAPLNSKQSLCCYAGL